MGAGPLRGEVLRHGLYSMDADLHMTHCARRTTLAWIAAACAPWAGAAWAGAAWGRAYPAKPLTVVVPYAPGGGVDIVARLITPALSTVLGQRIIIDNKPGGSANIGMASVARAPGDGYHLLMASNTLATNKALYTQLRYDPMRDLVPVGRIAQAPQVLVVPARSPWRSLADLVASGQARPQSLAYGSAGIGSSGHLSAALLAQAGQFSANHVPYLGNALAKTDLLGGRLDFMVTSPLEVGRLVRQGALRALAVLNDQGCALLPGTATAAAQGLDVHASVWWGLVAPAATPPALVQQLNTALNRTLAQPAVARRLAAIGAIAGLGTPEEFEAFIHEHGTQMALLIRAADIRAD